MFMYMVLVVVEIFNIYCWHVVLSRKPKNWPEIACKSHKKKNLLDNQPNILPMDVLYIEVNIYGTNYMLLVF